MTKENKETLIWTIFALSDLVDITRESKQKFVDRSLAAFDELEGKETKLPEYRTLTHKDREFDIQLNKAIQEGWSIAGQLNTTPYVDNETEHSILLSR